jgi:hypothetical protein
MQIMKKPKKLNLKRIKPTKPKTNIFRRAKTVEQRVSDAISNVPRITNETVADHREDVLSTARKYIYPLQHSKHSVVRTSIGILLTVIVAFFIFCGLDLYKFQGTSGFIYDVTKIIPFPVAKVGNSWASYESYLFQLRRNIHYYSIQQKTDFSSSNGKLQLASLKRQALNYAIEEDLVNQLASKYDLRVTSKRLNSEVALLRDENRLGSSNTVFQEVLSEYYGWSEADFKESLSQQLLQQAVVTRLDTSAQSRAEDVLTQLNKGADFSTLASQVSDDAATKSNAGQYPNAITIDDPDIAPAITNALFQMKPGQISGIINTGFTLDIVKLIDKSAGSVHAAHIQFNLNSITYYTNSLRSKERTHEYIGV